MKRLFFINHDSINGLSDTLIEIVLEVVTR